MSIDNVKAKFKSSLAPLVKLVFPYLLLTAPITQSKPIEEFCLTKEIQKNSENIDLLEIESSRVPPIIINFISGNKQYHLISGKRIRNSEILLEDEYNNRISSIIALQVSGLLGEGYIKNMALSASEWLWIDGEYTDYIAKLNVDATPPTVSLPIDISKLTHTGCFPLTGIFGCQKNKSFYSQTLERIFFYSENRTFFGLFPALSLEIVDGKVSSLPFDLGGSYHAFLNSQNEFLYELPELKGVLFGDAHFYDGNMVTSLLDPKIYGEKPFWRLELSPISRRVFLHIRMEKLQRESVLVELKPHLKVTSIFLPDNAINDTLTSYELDQSTSVFWRGFHSNTLNIQIENVLRTVLIAKKPFILGNFKYIGTPPNDAIFFNLINSKTQKKIDYSIIRATSSNKCLVTLNPDYPLTLGHEN